MSIILKGAYFADSEGGTPIILAEAGGSWCYPSTEQEYNTQNNPKPEPSQEQKPGTVNQEAFNHFLHNELYQAVSEMNKQTNVLRNVLVEFPEADRNVLLPLFPAITDSLTALMRKITQLQIQHDGNH